MHNSVVARPLARLPPAQQRVLMSADTALMSACGTLAFPNAKFFFARILSFRHVSSVTSTALRTLRALPDNQTEQRQKAAGPYFEYGVHPVILQPPGETAGHEAETEPDWNQARDRPFLIRK